MRTVIVGIDIDERCNDDDDDDDDAPVKLRIQSLLHGRLHYKSGTNIWRCSNSNLPCICFPFEQPWHCLHIWWKIIFSLKHTEMTEMTKTSCVLCSDRSFLFFIRQKYRSTEDFFSIFTPNSKCSTLKYWLTEAVYFIYIRSDACLEQNFFEIRTFVVLSILYNLPLFKTERSLYIIHSSLLCFRPPPLISGSLERSNGGRGLSGETFASVETPFINIVETFTWIITGSLQKHLQCLREHHRCFHTKSQANVSQFVDLVFNFPPSLAHGCHLNWKAHQMLSSGEGAYAPCRFKEESQCLSIRNPEMPSLV